jgi:hypothetical protein
MVAAPPTGTQLIIVRNVPATQETDYLANDPFPAESHERALDKLTMLVQQELTESDRALKIPLSSLPTTSTELPIPSANKLLAWNSNASAVTNFDPADVVTVVGQQNSFADVFTGNGSTVNFTLTRNPGSVFNIDVSINGVTQIPNVDYTLSGTTLTFTTAPPSVASQILARYSEVYAFATADADNVRYVPAGTGAVVTNVQDKLRNVVDVTDFMTAAEIADAKLAVPTLSVHSAVQKAVDYCLTFDPPAVLTVSVLCRLDSSVNIDRGVDATNASTYFIIQGNGIGGGFYAYNGVNLFSTTLPSSDPGGQVASQKIHFDNIVFKSEFPSNPVYVLDGGKFLRMKFTNCSFHRIKLLTSTAYLQTYYFNNCMAYGWLNTFFSGSDGAYDIKFDNFVAEAGTAFYSVTCTSTGNPNAQVSFTNSLFQSISGAPINADKAQGFVVENCYFEGNGSNGAPDIKFDTTSNLANLTPNGSIKVTGCFFSQRLANFNDPSYYSIRWGRVKNGFAAANYLVDLGSGASLKLSNTIPESRVVFLGEDGYNQGHFSEFVFAGAGYVMPGTGGEALKTLRGNVAANGTINQGTGFTITKTGTGEYQLDMLTAFGSIPTVVVTAADSNGTNVASFALPANSATTEISFRNTANAFVDTAFSFIAVGPAA